MFDYKRILSFFKKEFTLLDIGLIALIIFAYVGIRVTNLDLFPIFNDEGIYIQWAKTAKVDANWRFISLTDGKQPLQTWLTIPMLKFFAENPLFAGRMTAVLTGFVALAGIFTLLFYLFNKRVAYIGAFLYVITPFFIFYDRLAMIDSGVHAAFIWILFFSILLVRTLRLDVALIFGLAGGIGLLAKSSVMMFIALAAFAPILAAEKTLKESFKHKNKIINHAINYWILYVLAAVMAFAIYNIQRLSPFFHYIQEKNTTFVLTPAEFLANPFGLVFRNIPLIPYYIASEMGYVIALFGVIGLWKLWQNDKRLFTYFGISIALPFIFVSFFNEVLFPRYIIFFAGWMLILAAYFLGTLKNKVIFYSCIALAVGSVLYFNYTLLFAPAKIPLPQVDRGQYIEGWPAGWGIKEIVEYAREQVKTEKKPVLILAEGNFGMAGDVLNSMIKPSDTDISVIGMWPLDRKDLIATQPRLKDTTVLLVFPHRTEFPPDWPVELVKEYKKPGNGSQIFLYRLKSEPNE